MFWKQIKLPVLQELDFNEINRNLKVLQNFYYSKSQVKKKSQNLLGGHFAKLIFNARRHFTVYYYSTYYYCDFFVVCEIHSVH